MCFLVLFAPIKYQVPAVRPSPSFLAPDLVSLGLSVRRPGGPTLAQQLGGARGGEAQRGPREKRGGTSTVWSSSPIGCLRDPKTFLDGDVFDTVM